jgi:hypothetical protein
MSNLYELETIDGLPKKMQGWVPALHRRMNVKVGMHARLFVFVNGMYEIAPWVQVVKVSGTTYTGKVGGIMNSPDWHPYGTLVDFGPENIIDVDGQGEA